MKEFDLIVIGAGPGGYEAALEAAAGGLHTALIEKEAVGGTCLNHGCIPTKALLHAAELYRGALEAGTFGVRMQASYDMAAMQTRKNEVVSTLRQGIEARMKKAKVEVLHGIGTLVDPHTVQVGEEQIRGEKILIATGSRVSVPPIPGAEYALTSDELLEVKAPFEHLLIIGGGVIGMEFASLYSALGRKVTVIEAMSRILPTLDKEISQSLKMLMKKRGVEIHTDARVMEIRADHSCVFIEKEKEQTVQADGILICTGRRANTEGLFAGEALVEMDRGRIVVNAVGQTSVPHIYAIGDVAVGPRQKYMLAHEATAEGLNAVHHMLGQDADICLETMPACVFTEPEIASVGLTADQAKELGIVAESRKVPMSANGKTVVCGAERGFIKVVYGAEDHKILGAQMMCERATDMVSEFAVAITRGLTMEEMTRVVRPHPTFSEAITEVVRI
ncbi:MAG: dihydrolipoyl dehydrogenase [Firmicutes bacterium]|nr:dihydrolipoyl dehydrogenase [Bacillota bacterium]